MKDTPIFADGFGKVKSKSYYQKTLSRLDKELVKDIKIVYDLIEEGGVIAINKRNANPTEVYISFKEIRRKKLSISRFLEITNLLSQKKFYVLNPNRIETRDNDSIYIEYFGFMTNDPYYEPFTSNYGNFEKTLKDIFAKENKTKKITTPKFKKNPPQIIWNGETIPIPYASNQYNACMILFQKKKGENISWDEISEEIHGNRDFVKDSWRQVYDAIRAINEKVKIKTGKKLFTTSRKSFYRIY